MGKWSNANERNSILSVLTSDEKKFHHHHDDDDDEVDVAGGDEADDERVCLTANHSTMSNVSDDEDDDCFLSSNSIYKGLVCSSLSSVFFSLCTVIVKCVQLEPSVLAVFRLTGIFVFSIPLLVYAQRAPFGPRQLRIYLVVSGVVGAITLILRFYAIRYLPIGDASVIIFSIPIFVSLFACLCLEVGCNRIKFNLVGENFFSSSNHPHPHTLPPKPGNVQRIPEVHDRVGDDRTRVHHEITDFN